MVVPAIINKRKINYNRILKSRKIYSLRISYNTNKKNTLKRRREKSRKRCSVMTRKSKNILCIGKSNLDLKIRIYEKDYDDF